VVNVVNIGNVEIGGRDGVTDQGLEATMAAGMSLVPQ